MIYRMLAGGFLNATSVGFQPVEWTYNEDHGGYDFIRNELLEHSVVPVPANPEALMQASKSGIDLRPMREWVERFLDNDPQVQRFTLVPHELAEQAWKELRCVDGSQMPTVTSGFMHVMGQSGDTDNTVTLTTSDGTAVAGDNTVWTPYPYDGMWFRGYGPDWWYREVGTATQQRTETDMENELKELTEQIRLLREDLTKFMDVMESKSEPDPDPDPVLDDDDDNMTEDELRQIVGDTVRDTMTAITGKLPD
jgi:hypothetical protein